MNFPVTVRGVEAEPLPVGTYQVSPDFFRMFGLQLLAGRELNHADSHTDSGFSAAIVSSDSSSVLVSPATTSSGAPSSSRSVLP